MSGIYEYLTHFNEFFTNTNLTIPAIQMIYYVGLINILMLLRRYRLCYMVSLTFSLYWLMVLNKGKFVSPQGDFGVNGMFVVGSGLFLLLFAIFCFLTQPED